MLFSCTEKVVENCQNNFDSENLDKKVNFHGGYLLVL